MLHRKKANRPPAAPRGAGQLLRRDLRRDWQLYLFLVLPVIYIILFAYVPMGGLQIAFRNYRVRDGIWGSEWVGLEHFLKFFNSYSFTTTVKNTLSLSFYSILFGFPIPILMALTLNCIRSTKYRNLVQTITTLPHFISVVVLVGMMFQMFNARYGLYGAAVKALTGAAPEDPFSVASNFPHFYIWSGIWQTFGWNAIIYIAALSGVDPALHEAATVEGASRLQRVLHIDLPAIAPTIVIMLILRMGSVMSIGFEKIYLMQNGVNLPYSEVISTYVYKQGIAATTPNFSYATAVGLFNSVINLIMISLTNFISGKLTDSSLW